MISKIQESPAMGERRARWGYGYQDKIATERILNLLRESLRTGNAVFEGVRLADLDAGRVDDFVLVWEKTVEGNSIKWSGDATPFNWGDLIGSNGLLKELADGYRRLKERWPDKAVAVRLQSNRLPSSEKHHAQLISTFSVAEFIRDYWISGPSDDGSIELAAVWLRIAEHVGLTGTEFSMFVKSCIFNLGYPEPPGSGTDSQDWRHYNKQFEDLHKAIATWLTKNPQSEFIDRRILLAAIGYRGYRSGLIQRFPPPQIPYTKNGTSAEKLKQLIDKTEGGYIAVVGSAGIGKSTLVQDVLSNSQYPYFIPYYAFLPEIDGNRERGEALTFFQDTIGRLDKFFTGRYSLGISDIAHGRAELREHMARANKEYVSQGQKTILLIDGLDHISREINLQNTLLHELPDPAEIPDGFLIILSSQPQALIPGIIVESVGNAVASKSDRRIEVSGLSRPEVHAIIEKVAKATADSERDALYGASLGNPLILTYLLKIFQRAPETTVKEAIALSGTYTGDIAKYYQSALSTALKDAKARKLLGLLCRAAPTIPVVWLQEWPEQDQLEDLLYQTLAPFIQEEEGNLKFIHNSLIAFLKSETRSKIPGADLSADERKFHSTLADRCGNHSCVDPLGRAKVLHLSHSGRVEELLNLLAPPLPRKTALGTEPSTFSSDWLRQAIEAFMPYTFVYPLLLSGLAAAWNLDRLGEVLRLILLDHEFSQRTSRLESGDLAEKFLALKRPELAIAQVRAAGRLLVKDSVALDFSQSLWLYAVDHSREELKKTAQSIYLQAKPISLFYQHEPIDTFRQHDDYKNLRSWSNTAPLFEDSGNIITQIRKLRFKVQGYGEKAEESDMKAGLLYGALLTTLDCNANTDFFKTIVDEIAGLGLPNWRLAALLSLARRRPSYFILEDIKTAHRELERDDDSDLAYAQFLYNNGYREESREIVAPLPHIRFDGFQRDHSFGFSDISYTVTLRHLQDLLELPEGPVPGVKDEEEEANARVEKAARQLGALSAIVKMGKAIPSLNDSIRSLLLFHNRAVKFPEFDWRRNYAVTQAKKEIYRQIMRLAASIGRKGLEFLRDILLELVSGPAGSQFSAHHRRYFAAELFHHQVLSKEQAVEFGLSSTSDATDDDPMQRQEACFEIAIFLHSVGEDILSNQWIKRAGEVSAGAGSHKDDHMANLAKWLSRSIGNTLDPDKLEVLAKFARAVEVAGGDGTSKAAMNILECLILVDPIRASRLAVEFIDRGVLNVSQTIDSLILGGSQVGVSGELLIAVYNELLSLMDPSGTTAAAVVSLRGFPIEKRISAAKSMMNSVRTNSLPSFRIEIARAIQDALRKDGLGEHILTRGLRPNHNDSSRRRELYKCTDGEIETMDYVAAHLSNHANPQQWNPNPSENTEFDWWSAIKKAKIHDIAHLNDLLSSFSPPDYREVELLSWKSERLWEMEDHQTAKLLAEQAIKRAGDGSWHRWLDGAQKKTAYGALKKINAHEALQQAREQFGKDLSAGKLNSTYLLYDILGTMDFLELNWPCKDIRRAIDDYLDYVLAANAETKPYFSLTHVSENGSGDEAFCRFLIHLLAFPVVDVGVAARNALSSYAATDGKGLAATIKGKPCWDSVQLEYILACLHTGLCHGNVALNNLQDWISNLNKHESIAVRAVARRICEEQGWPWEEIRHQVKQPVIILSTSLKSPTDYKEASMLVDGDIATGLLLHRRIFAGLERAGLEADELKSEFHRTYKEIERDYSWTDENRLNRWIKLVLARHWLHPRGIVGREAAMRVLGRRALTGEAPSGAESAYDHIYPIYDPELELCKAVERPAELHALDDELWNDRGKAWLRGENADSWNNYLDSIDGFHIIGERTWFIRPDWEWPREERHRGLIIGPCDPDQERQCLETSREVTFDLYLRGAGQEDGQLIVLNSERQLVGPAYRWAAFNSSLANRLGWHPVENETFTWVDSLGNLMVKSVYWKDGWIWLEPPRFESLGEGWLVLATDQGLRSIQSASSHIESHLWVERHSYGDKPYEGKWHLSKRL